MRKLLLMIVWILSWAGAAEAQWTKLTNGLDETEIKFAAADVRNPNILFAAADRHLYRSADEGKNWKRVLGLRGAADKINFVLVNPLNPLEIVVATDKGVRLSREGGKKWELIFSGLGEVSKRCLCVAVSLREPEEIYVGTAEGLFSVNKKTLEARRIDSLPAAPVRSIFVNEDRNSGILVATEKGIYRNKEGSDFWERVFVNPEGNAKEGEISLEQFEIEEIFTTPFFSNMGFLAAQNRFYAATRDGLLEAGGDAGSWVPKVNQNLPDKKVNAVTCSSTSVYVATNQGVFKSDPEAHSFLSLNEGLESKEVNFIFYNPGGDYLLAATKKGIFKHVYPELKPEIVLAAPRRGSPAPEEVLRLFQNEPAIQAVQEAAIRYAEVHPSKIEGWRQAAAIKAFMPRVSVDTGLSADENVDLDRGGTNDPDKFIIGPQEKSYDWSVGFNWDLGEIIWNNDQTSIDTRSRLMVELRDDVLNEVTHLYYERRRLQVEMALSSVRELPVQIEKELRLQELTAGIDALTGGYYSKKLQNSANR